MKNIIRKFFSAFLPLFSVFVLSAQEGQIRNVILMIPDGTSANVLSIARWYQYYQNQDKTRLAVDPYLCGWVKTHSSDAPIGDSAPTTSCYVTGQPTQTGFISMYPQKTLHDLYPIDSARTYQPMATVLEAAKMLQGKSTGLVFTCEFPHATPADCAAHWYNRKEYDVIGKQMVYQDLDVLIGGGNKFLSLKEQEYLEEQGYEVLRDDIARFRQSNSRKLWALFEQEALPYEIDRDPDSVPSLAEMTRKAIRLLSENETGFFLMVEGSKIDWAAHDNDAKTMIMEFLAFDEAVKVAIDFANRDGQTVVVVLPDHGNSGISLGSKNSHWNYDRLTLDTIMQPLTHFSISTSQMAQKVKSTPPEQLDELFRQYYRIELTQKDKDTLYATRDYDLSPIPYEKRKKKQPMVYALSDILYGKTYIGFTTFGHTGEDVFLAVYHPNGDVPYGLNTNIEMNDYLCRQMNLLGVLPKLTSDLFASHNEVLSDIKDVRIDSLPNNTYYLTAKKGKKQLMLESNTNYVLVNGEKIPLGSVAIYVNKNKTFYIPRKVRMYLD